MPSSTSAGVFGITRTTAVPSGSRASRNAVVMPAASETTSCPGRTTGASSSSTSPMSCGFTTSTRVSARPAASTLETTSTPYRSSSSAARSRRFSPTSRSAGRRPDRIRPESRVSPITPAPMMATVTAGSYFLETSEWTKNVRLLGRSASRRMR